MTANPARILPVLKRHAPDRIDDLWSPVWTATGDQDFQLQDEMARGMTHVFVERLFDWADDDMIDELLEDETRLESLVVELADAALQLGLNAQQLNPPGTLVSGSCLACNSSTDNETIDPHYDFRVRIDLSSVCPKNEAIVSYNLHRSVVLLTLAAHLLSKRKSYKLAALMTPEPPPGVTYPEFVPLLASSGKGGFAVYFSCLPWWTMLPPSFQRLRCMQPVVCHWQ